MSTITERVAAGAAWLDRKLPDWWKTHLIDLSKFDMARDCRCVIGQLSPEKNYGDAVEDEWLDLTHDLAADLGFYSRDQLREEGLGIDDERVAREYAALDAEWVRVISERRASG